MSKQTSFNPQEPIGTAAGKPVYATSAFLRFLQRAPQSTTFARLPDPAKAGMGSRNFITDATAPVFGDIAVGGGDTPSPVYSDGSAWRIG